MRPSRYLLDLNRDILRSIAKARSLVLGASLLEWEHCDRIAAAVTLSLQNSWAHFCRSYALSCTLTPKTISGTTIHLGNPAIKTYAHVIEAALRRRKAYILRRRTWTCRDEPAWHEPATILDTCDELQCSNLSQLHAALSTGTKVFEYLPTVRNFYAHRNECTARKVIPVARYYSIVAKPHPTTILFSVAHSRTQSLLLDWLDDVRIVVNAACA